MQQCVARLMVHGFAASVVAKRYATTMMRKQAGMPHRQGLRQAERKCGTEVCSKCMLCQWETADAGDGRTAECLALLLLQVVC